VKTAINSELGPYFIEMKSAGTQGEVCVSVQRRPSPWSQLPLLSSTSDSAVSKVGRSPNMWQQRSPYRSHEAAISALGPNGTPDKTMDLLATFTSVRSDALNTTPPRTDRCFQVSAIGFPLPPLPWHPKLNQDGRYTRSEPSISLITSLLLTDGNTVVLQGDVSLQSRPRFMVVSCSFDRDRSYIESYGF
jgi:hypothetical protein